MGKIKNIKELVCSPQRKTLLKIAEAGFLAVDTQKAMKDKIKYDSNAQKLEILGQKWDLSKISRVMLFGFGKAADAAGREAIRILGDRISEGVIIAQADNEGKKMPEYFGKVKFFYGTHPLPSLVNVEASEEIEELAKNAGENDLVICLISGGGSALFCDRGEWEVQKQAQVFKILSKNGANIFELNTVRKHLSKLKGGNLAKLIYPAQVISLIISDVPGDDLSIISSAPTVLDISTIHEAKNILQKYNILEKTGLRKLKLLETPKEQQYFAKCQNLLFLSGRDAIYAMFKIAEDFGFKTKIYLNGFSGDAEILARDIFAASKNGECLLGSGESTVKIAGSGVGGRNMHMSLAILPLLKQDQIFCSFASDGRDNTDFAGAIADKFTQDKAKKIGLDPKLYLQDSDSYSFFKTTGDLVLTGLTHSNVSDFFVFLG